MRFQLAVGNRVRVLLLPGPLSTDGHSCSRCLQPGETLLKSFQQESGAMGNSVTQCSLPARRRPSATFAPLTSEAQGTHRLSSLCLQVGPWSSPMRLFPVGKSPGERLTPPTTSFSTSKKPRGAKVPWQALRGALGWWRLTASPFSWGECLCSLFPPAPP